MENQKSNPVIWFEIYVEDMDRAIKFYEEVLNIKFHDMPDPTDQAVVMKAFPDGNSNFGASGALVKMNGMKSGSGGTLIYFGCEDCSTEESRANKAGGLISQTKTSLGEFGFCSVITDTEGNNIGLHSMK